MNRTISWLLKGDPSIQYLTHRYLLDSDEVILTQLQERIAAEGFGARFLSCQTESGHWGLYYYQPKWTSTHYTLLDLKNLGAPEILQPCREIITKMFDECMAEDGGLNLSKYQHPSDICVEGMILNYAAYFCKDEPRLTKVADFILAAQKKDGGFTWDLLSEAGDPHSTICVLEGFGQFSLLGLEHRRQEIDESRLRAMEYLLSNQLFLNSADKRFRMLSYPYRYRYDLLRALECFATQGVTYDGRMQPAIDWLKEKRQKDGLWYLENQHKGRTHFIMEEVKKPSRFITLKALCILNYYCVKD